MSEDLRHKLPPHDTDAEMCLLASMMLDKDVIRPCLDVVDRDAFFSIDNKLIFDTIVSLYTGAKAIDAIMVRDELRNRGVYDDVGGDGQLGALLNKVPSAAHGPHYAGIVADKHKLRQLIVASNEILRLAHAPHEDAGAVVGAAMEALAGVNRPLSTLQPMSAEALLRDFPEQAPPIVSGVFRAGEVGNINAASKSLKSFLMMDLAISVALGLPWLGTFQTFPGRVLIIDNELMKGTIGYRLPRIAAARGLSAGDYASNLDVLSLRGNLLDLYQLESQVIRHIPADRYALIVLDAFYRTLPKGVDENSNADVTHLFNIEDRWAARTGAAICNVHHASKGNQSDKSTIDVGSGAGAMARAADFLIAMRPHEEDECAVLSFALRSSAPIRPMALRWTYPTWNPAPDLDPMRLRRDPSRGRQKKDAGTPADAPTEPWTAERFVAAFVTVSPTPKLVLESVACRSMPGREFKGLLAEAEHAGLIHRHPTGTTTGVAFATIKPTLFSECASEERESARAPHTPQHARRRKRRDAGN